MSIMKTTALEHGRRHVANFIKPPRAARGIVLAAALLAASLNAPAPAAADSGDQSLESRLAELEARITALQAEGETEAIDAARAEAVRGLVMDVLADSEGRASLLQDGLQAGWDKSRGFFVGSTDGSFLLKLSGQLQVRAIYNHQEDSPSDDDRFGFEIRRAKVQFSGHVADPSWEYFIELQFDRSSGAGVLGEDAWIQKNLGHGFKARVGQFKPVFLREEFVSSKRLFNVERSLVNSQFSIGTSQGATVAYERDRWRAWASIHDGRNAENSPWSDEDVEYAFAGRGEWLALGEWATMAGYTGFRDTQTAIMAGAGVDYEKAESGTGSNLPPPDFNNAEVENLSLTADVTMIFDGASAAAAVVYRRLDAESGVAADTDLDQIAFLVRGGLFITNTVELIAQYEWGDLDIDGIDELSVVTVGVNKYFDKHNLKWQTDVGYGINAVAPQWASSGAGWRGDSPDEDGQTVIRSQLQLLF
jgi:hypothetical protein